jgi:predicted dehydrogenase
LSKRRISRRFFILSSTATLAGCATSASKRIRYVSPNEKVNVVGIGVGGMGRGDINNIHETGEANIVGLCDVDERRAGQTFYEFPKAKVYKDYRKMLDEMKDIDAVVVSTPDHLHAPAALHAMSLGKHVRVQKPMTWSIYEARTLHKAARKYNVVTAMGNQGHSNGGVRQLCEMLWNDAIGDVLEAHVWTDRPIWPQGIAAPLPKQDIPKEVDWDLWLGPAPVRPFNESYLPFKWRGWWDFGTGALGDMGCHILDPANWALQLGSPSTVEVVKMDGFTTQCAPTGCIVKYEFPERKFQEDYKDLPWSNRRLPPVTLYWYEGTCSQRHLPRPEGISEKEVLGDINNKGVDGSYFVGTKGILTCARRGGDNRIISGEKMNDFTMPDEVIPRVPDGCYHEWVRAIKGGPKPCSNFDYAAPFTETVLLGNLAMHSGVGMPLTWDAENMKVPGHPELDQWIRREYRPGFEVEL